MKDNVSFKKISNQEDSKLASELILEMLKSKEGFELLGKYINSFFSGVDMTKISKIENINCKHIEKNTGEIDMIYDKDLDCKLSEELDSILESSGDNAVIVVYGPTESGKSRLLNNLNKRTGVQKLSNRVINDRLIKNFSNGLFGNKGIILDEAEIFIERHKGKKIKDGKYILSIQAPLEDRDKKHLAKTLRDVQTVFGKKRVKIICL